MADDLQARLTFDGGVTAKVRVGSLAVTKTRCLRLVGTDATAIWDDSAPVSRLWLETATGRRELPLCPEEPLAREARHFASVILENAAPVTGADYGLGVVRLLEAGQRALRMGHAVSMSNHPDDTARCHMERPSPQSATQVP
jgi:predicted dehydrogenase